MVNLDAPFGQELFHITVRESVAQQATPPRAASAVDPRLSNGSGANSPTSATRSRQARCGLCPGCMMWMTYSAPRVAKIRVRSASLSRGQLAQGCSIPGMA